MCKCHRRRSDEQIETKKVKMFACLQYGILCMVALKYTWLSLVGAILIPRDHRGILNREFFIFDFSKLSPP
jgi:hypothetical protein